MSAYATKAQLMDNTFAPNLSGNAANIGKLVFGKNSESNSQEWYILGKDKGISGNNTIIFAASPIATNQVFEDKFSDNKTFQSSFGVYASKPTEVYPNHYGASDLRVALRNMATNASHFTTAERGLMNPTTVTTKDTKNSTNYTTTDKLYALQGDHTNNQYLWAGTGDSTVLAMNSYCSDEYWFWLRSPYDYSDYGALLASPGDDNGDYIRSYDVDWVEQVQPASNLNLSSVLFASAAKASSSGTAESGTIAEGTAMTLRFNGRSKNIGTVTYNTTTGDIKAVKGSTSQTVALFVQGRGTVRREEKDWYYSKQIDTSETINASAIKSALGLSSDIDLSDCKIWLEITDSTENLTYAVGATETTIADISSVEITGIDTPVANTTLDTEASCAATGVKSTTPQITWTPSDTTAGYNTSYTASITLTAGTGYEFTDSTTATVNGNTATSVTKNVDGTLTVTYTFPGISDTIAPVISGVENGKTYCSAQTVTVSDNDAIEKVTVNGTEVTLDEHNQFTLSPAPGEQKIIATDKSDNPAEVTVTVNDGHTYGEWQSNGNNTHICYCTVTDCDGSEDSDCAGGTATYFKKAVCDTCHTEYGNLLTDTTVPSGEISIDANKWNSFLNTITFGVFIKDTQRVTITASDDSYSHDGYTDDKAVKVEHYLYSSNTALTKEDLAGKTFTVYDGSFNINPDNKYVVYAKLTDHAGNVTYISSNGVVLDAAAPVISGVENGKTYCEAQTVTVTEEYIASVTVNDVAVTLDVNNQFTLNPAEGTQTIIVTDKAGNQTSVSVTVNDGHTYGKWQSNGDGTHTRLCTVDSCSGYEDDNCAGGTATCKAKAICGYCGSEYGEIDSSNHNLNNIPATDATVTETGNIEYWHCKDCENNFSDAAGTNVITDLEAWKAGDGKIDKLNPEILEGKGQSITAGEKKDLTFRSNAAFSDFIRAQLDGKTLDEKNYIVKEGSTIVTLKADYVATLSAGEHTIGIVSTNGTAETTFTVASSQKPAGNNPSDSTGNNPNNPTGSNSNTGSVKHVSKTGDNSHMALWIALMLISGILLSVLGIYGKKKKNNR